MSVSGRQPTAFSIPLSAFRCRPIVQRRADAERAIKGPLGSTLQAPQISELGLQISEHRISYFALPISSFRLPICDLRTSDFSTWTSALSHLLSDDGTPFALQCFYNETGPRTSDTRQNSAEFRLKLITQT